MRCRRSIRDHAIIMSTVLEKKRTTRFTTEKGGRALLSRAKRGERGVSSISQKRRHISHPARGGKKKMAQLHLRKEELRGIFGKRGRGSIYNFREGTRR